MLGHEGRDEIIAVVVARAAAKGERDPGLGTGPFEQVGTKLALEERVGLAHIDQQLANPRARADQRDRVMRSPRRAIGPEIPRERLLPPRHERRCDDRGKGRNAAEPLWIGQADGQRRGRPLNGR